MCNAFVQQFLKANL